MFVIILYDSFFKYTEVYKLLYFYLLPILTYMIFLYYLSSSLFSLLLGSLSSLIIMFLSLLCSSVQQKQDYLLNSFLSNNILPILKTGFHIDRSVET